MEHIDIYTKPTCPFCIKAKQLLQSKGAVFTEIDIQEQPELRESMIARANGRQSVPQIFIGERHVGGCDDLNALDAKGELDSLLKSGPA